MADNTTLDSGSGGDSIRTEDKSGVKTPVTLIDVSGTGTENLITDGTQGMPSEGVAAENAAVAGNPVLVGARYDASPRTLDDGDVGAIALDADGAVHIADGGNTITVDGTVNAAQSGTWNVTNVSGTVSLPTGAATETTLQAIQTAVELIDDAVSGSELQVDIVAALPAGTNAIGKLAANSGVDIGDVDVTSQPARVATTDNIGAALLTNVIHNGTTALTPKFAAIDVATSGDNTLVAAVSSKKIRVLSLILVAGGDVDVRFESGAGGTALTGQMDLTANSGFTLPFNPVGWFETAATTLLNLELSGNVAVDGCLTYVEI